MTADYEGWQTFPETHTPIIDGIFRRRCILKESPWVDLQIYHDFQ